MKMKGFNMKDKNSKLIKLLIALAVTGFLVTLLVVLFPNSTRKASIGSSATKIYNDMHAVYDASQRYSAQIGGPTTDIESLITSRYLTVVPVPPPSVKAEGYGGFYNYYIDSATHNAFKTAAADAVVMLIGLNDTVCQKFNEKYAAAVPGAPIPTAVDYTKDTQCFNNGTNNLALRIIYAK